NDKGAPHRLADAAAFVHPGSTAATNAQGVAFVLLPEAPYGEYVVVGAEKAGYKTESVRVLVTDANAVNEVTATTGVGNLFLALTEKRFPAITIALEPDNEAGPEVELVVQVEDENCQPVRGALVALDRTSPPLGELGHSYSGANGEA